MAVAANIVTTVTSASRQTRQIAKSANITRQHDVTILVEIANIKSGKTYHFGKTIEGKLV